MKMSLARGMKHYALEEQRAPLQPGMEMQRVSKEYGGSDGNDGSGRNKTHLRSGGQKDGAVRRMEGENQRLTIFGPTTSLFYFLAHVGGFAVWWGWMS